jgi:hypothetical protein
MDLQVREGVREQGWGRRGAGSKSQAHPVPEGREPSLMGISCTQSYHCQAAIRLGAEGQLQNRLLSGRT